MENSGYYRIFSRCRAIYKPVALGIAQLVQEIHSLTISQGNILEKLIKSTFPNDTRAYFRYRVQREGKKTHVYDIYLPDDKVVYEIKDGCNFDTKKAEGEIEALVTNFDDSYMKAIVFWNAENLRDISFKAWDERVHLFTGRQFCEHVNINFDEIQNERYKDGPELMEKYVETMREIVKMYDSLKSRDAQCQSHSQHDQNEF